MNLQDYTTCADALVFGCINVKAQFVPDTVKSPDTLLFRVYSAVFDVDSRPVLGATIYPSALWDGEIFFMMYMLYSQVCK